jgi:hypothetical protein
MTDLHPTPGHSPRRRTPTPPKKSGARRVQCDGSAGMGLPNDRRTSEAPSLSTQGAAPVSFELLPGRSAVLIKARSNVGPISFATTQITGRFSAAIKDRQLVTDGIIEGHLEVSLKDLTSGNNLYDTELRRRIDTRRYPLAILELRSANRSTDQARYDLSASIELHNLTREIQGSVSIEITSANSAVVRGEQTLDVRDFDLEVPTTLALKIYPDVLIEMHLEGRAP